MYYNSNQIREDIKEITEEIERCVELRKYTEADTLELELDDLYQELRSKERSNYYSIEK